MDELPVLDSEGRQYISNQEPKSWLDGVRGGTIVNFYELHDSSQLMRSPEEPTPLHEGYKI